MGKVLILDDEEDIGLALADGFEYSGHALPDVVTQAEKAMTMLKDNNYALAVIDAKLSGKISGIEVIRYCRELNPRPKIFAMSGITKTNLKDLLTDEGVIDLVDRILEKPVDIQPKEFVNLLSKMGII